MSSQSNRSKRFSSDAITEALCYSGAVLALVIGVTSHSDTAQLAGFVGAMSVAFCTAISFTVKKDRAAAAATAAGNK